MESFRRGIVTATPMMIGFIPLGFILGTQAHLVGQSILTTYLMTALNFAGGSEFAALSLWSIAPPLLLLCFSTFLINSRHIVMGASLAPYIQNESGFRIFFIYFFMCDETWALAMQQLQRENNNQPKFSFAFYMGVGISLWLAWTLSCSLGAFVGGQIAFPSNFAFHIAFPATFIALAVAMRPKGFKGLERLLNYCPIVCSFSASILAAYTLEPVYSVACGILAGLVSAYFVQIYKEKHGMIETNKTNQDSL